MEDERKRIENRLGHRNDVAVVIRPAAGRDLALLVDRRDVVLVPAALVEMLLVADRREVIGVHDRRDLVADLEEKRE